MTTFKMLVGLPASGKSTYAKHLKDHGYHIHSSDEFREATGETNPGIIFTVLYKEIVKDVKNGQNCVLDATSLKRKHRIALLDRLKDYDVKKECELFIVPISVLKERNKGRINNHGVDDSVIETMLRDFECPWYSEGFDTITVHAYTEDFDIGYTRSDLMNMDQENPHHALTVGMHEEKAVEYISQKCLFTENCPFLEIAARYHDDGKFFTKSFYDQNGNITGTAHYYAHEHVSAYLFLLRAFCMRQFDREEEYHLTDWGCLYVANLINWHMRPFKAWRVSRKAEKKDRKRMGKELYKDVCTLREADIYAH